MPDHTRVPYTVNHAFDGSVRVRVHDCNRSASGRSNGMGLVCRTAAYQSQKLGGKHASHLQPRVLLGFDAREDTAPRGPHTV